MLNNKEEKSVSEVLSTADVSYRKLVWWKFTRNRLAVVGAFILIFLYVLVLPAEFTAPYSLDERFVEMIKVPPQRLHFIKPDGSISIRPFVYG